jgi:hypothetical protein
MKYEHIIIGAGISGIYIGLQLLKQKINSFTILEAHDKNVPHGRLLSLNLNNNSVIEFGASIFHKNQKNIRDCISLLDMNDSIIEYGKDNYYYIMQKMSSKEALDYYLRLQKKLKMESIKDKYKSYTLEKLAKEILSRNEYKDYKLLNFEYYEHSEKQADLYFKAEENISTIFSIKDGVESLVKKGCKILESYIKYNSLIQSINYDKITKKYLLNIKNTETIECEKLYICTNLKNKIKINIPEVLPIIDLCKSRTCIRIYAEFNKPLSDIKPYFIVGDTIGKLSIKISSNVWLIAYMDGPYADSLENIDKDKIAKQWLFDINKHFKTNYSIEKDIKNVVKIYWKDAYTIFKEDYYKMYSSNIYKGKMLLNNLKEKHPNLMLNFIPQDDGFYIAWTEAVLYKIK